MTVPDLVLGLAVAGGVDTVGVPAWLGHSVQDYLTSQSLTARWRRGSVVTGDSWCWWFVPPGSATDPTGADTGVIWPAPSRYICLGPVGSRREQVPLAPDSPGAAICTHPILLSCAIRAFARSDPKHLTPGRAPAAAAQNRSP